MKKFFNRLKKNQKQIDDIDVNIKCINETSFYSNNNVLQQKQVDLNKCGAAKIDLMQERYEILEAIKAQTVIEIKNIQKEIRKSKIQGYATN